MPLPHPEDTAAWLGLAGNLGAVPAADLFVALREGGGRFDASMHAVILASIFKRARKAMMPKISEHRAMLDKVNLSKEERRTRGDDVYTDAEGDVYVAIGDALAAPHLEEAEMTAADKAQKDAVAFVADFEEHAKAVTRRVLSAKYKDRRRAGKMRPLDEQKVGGEAGLSAGLEDEEDKADWRRWTDEQILREAAALGNPRALNAVELKLAKPERSNADIAEEIGVSDRMIGKYLEKVGDRLRSNPHHEATT